jgi:glucose/arabinose dehydrogenase
MGRPRCIELRGLGTAMTVGLLVACGYIALPGGLIVNTPAFSADPLPPSELQRRITLPPGFTIDTYTAGLGTPRMLLFTDAGDLLVSAPRQGKVWLVKRSADGGAAAGGQRVLLDDLKQPHGLAYRDGWLYVAEGDAVLRIRFDSATGSVSGAPQRIIRDLPAGGNHWTRTVHVGPDGKLYVTIGSTCNVCVEDDQRRAAMLRYNVDGSGEELYATGLRNAVDFDWQPGTGALYATDNGRDLLGDDFPPCELNRVVRGRFYGWPFANGDRVPDPNYGAGHETEIAASVPPAHSFAAHTAPLGITFYEPPSNAAPAAFPARYHGVAFVAQHGSWNRSKKSGYQVVALHFQPDGAIREEPFATGFMIDEEVTGRPVDVAVGSDGALYVSDDFTGSIYRIAYGQAPQAGASPVARATARNPLAGLSREEIRAASARGAALWQTSGCAACHDASQASPNAYRPLDALSGKYSLDSLAQVLQTPPPPMPAYLFSDTERRDLAAYLMTAHP